MATSVPVRAFWSYSHFDDENEGARIAELARQLAREYEAITGSKLEIFIDRDLRWGDDWEKQLAEAVETSAFLIPVLTPSFFNSQACRNELLSFAAHSARAGAAKLLMPIYWIKVRELDAAGTGSPDEVVALAARHQWQDFTSVRLEEASSAEFRKAVNSAAEELASRIDELARQPALADDSPAPQETDEPDGEGWLENVARAEEELPRLGQLIETIGDESMTIGEIMAAETEGMGELSASGKLAVAARVANAIRPHTAKIQEVGREYANAIVAIDAGILVMLDPSGNGVVGDADIEAENLNSALELAETVVEVRDNALTDMIASAAESERHIRDLAKTSRVFREPAQQFQRGLQGLRDGQRRIDAWADLAAEQLRKHADYGDASPELQTEIEGSDGPETSPH